MVIWLDILMQLTWSLTLSGYTFWAGSVTIILAWAIGFWPTAPEAAFDCNWMRWNCDGCWGWGVGGGCSCNCDGGSGAFGSIGNCCWPDDGGNGGGGADELCCAVIVIIRNVPAADGSIADCGASVECIGIGAPLFALLLNRLLSILANAVFVLFICTGLVITSPVGDCCTNPPTWLSGDVCNGPMPGMTCCCWNQKKKIKIK